MPTGIKFEDVASCEHIFEGYVAKKKNYDGK